eukprot:scaffold45747_cov85-Attheya_sp.AAC.1
MSNSPTTDTASPLPSILHDALAPTIEDASVSVATELGPVAVEKSISSTTLFPYQQTINRPCQLLPCPTWLTRAPNLPQWDAAHRI